MSFAENGQPFGWSADGIVYFERDGVLSPHAQIALGSWQLRNVAVDSSGTAIGLVTLENEIGVLSASTDIGPTRIVLGSLLASARMQSNWDLLFVDSLNRLLYARFDVRAREVRRTELKSALPETSRRTLGMTATRVQAIVASTGDSLRLTCLNDSGETIQASRANSDLWAQFPDALRESSWAVTSVLPISDFYLLSMSDLRSRRRMALIVDARCQILRRTQLPDLLVPLSASMTTYEIIAADFRSGRQFVIFDWRWGAQN